MVDIRVSIMSDDGVQQLVHQIPEKYNDQDREGKMNIYAEGFSNGVIEALKALEPDRGWAEEGLEYE